MSNCPFCQSDLEEMMTICPFCNAKNGYFKVNNFIIGKSLLIFFGLIVPFMIILYAISAQNLFGVYVSIIMTLPILFAVWHLILGVRS
jgi:polyferredoxin